MNRASSHMICINSHRRLNRSWWMIPFLLSLFFSSASGQDANAKRMLEHAYRKKNTEELKKFFYAWQTDVQPNSKEEQQKMSDTVRNVISVFTDCYLPQTPKDFFILDPVVRVGIVSILSPDSIIVRNARRVMADSATLATMLRKTNGQLDQNVIDDYFYVEDFPDDQSLATVRNIRPAVSPDIAKKSLYMDEGWLNELTGFINNKIKKPTAKDLEDMEQRANFINNVLEVASNTGLSGCAIRVGNKFYPCEYYFDFYPKLTRILFAHNFRFAAVTFTYRNSAKELLFEKKGDRWIFTKLPALRSYNF